MDEMKETKLSEAVPHQQSMLIWSCTSPQAMRWTPQRSESWSIVPFSWNWISFKIAIRKPWQNHVLVNLKNTFLNNFGSKRNQKRKFWKNPSSWLFSGDVVHWNWLNAAEIVWGSALNAYVRKSWKPMSQVCDLRSERKKTRDCTARKQ